MPQIRAMSTRRHFLHACGLTLAGGVLASARALTVAEEPHRRLQRIGIQLYTVRDAMRRDPERTLARLAEFGYRAVEFAGYFERSPSQIRQVLRANRLTSPATHIAYPANDDAWRRTVDDAKARGHEWVVIAWLDAAQRAEASRWPVLAERFNQLGQIARDAGVRFAYHNHDFEFMPAGEHTGYDLLVSRTDPALVDFELDLYWATKAGQDPLALIARHRGRFPLVHVKDATAAPAREMVDVGKGTIDFAHIFAAANRSGMRHVFVEHDHPADSMASALASYRYLRALRY